jgi:hypothetical protein
MSQFNAPVKRAGGGISVYTGLLGAALIVLLIGVFLMAKRNMDHSGAGNPIALIDGR